MYSVLSPLQFSGIFNVPVKAASAPGINMSVCTKLVFASRAVMLERHASPFFSVRCSVCFCSLSTQSRWRVV